MFALTEYTDSQGMKLMLIKDWKDIVTQVGWRIVQLLACFVLIVLFTQTYERVAENFVGSLKRS